MPEEEFYERVADVWNNRRYTQYEVLRVVGDKTDLIMAVRFDLSLGHDHDRLCSYPRGSVLALCYRLAGDNQLQ